MGDAHVDDLAFSLERLISLVIPMRCTSPASVTLVSARSSHCRLVKSLRYTSPASEISLLLIGDLTDGHSEWKWTCMRLVSRWEQEAARNRDRELIDRCRERLLGRGPVSRGHAPAPSCRSSHVTERGIRRVDLRVPGVGSWLFRCLDTNAIQSRM